MTPRDTDRDDEKPSDDSTRESEPTVSFSESDSVSSATHESEMGSTSSAADSPLSDLAERVASYESDADPELDDLFDDQSVDDLDSEHLWDRLENESSPEQPLLGDERDVREIDAHTYCHQCEHFADPPEMACTLEGTEILEMPVMGTFRVADCPVVLEDEQLNKQY